MYIMHQYLRDIGLNINASTATCTDRFVSYEIRMLGYNISVGECECIAHTQLTPDGIVTYTQ